MQSDKSPGDEYRAIVCSEILKTYFADWGNTNTMAGSMAAVISKWRGPRVWGGMKALGPSTYKILGASSPNKASPTQTATSLSLSLSLSLSILSPHEANVIPPAGPKFLPHNDSTAARSIERPVVATLQISIPPIIYSSTIISEQADTMRIRAEGTFPPWRTEWEELQGPAV